MISLSTLFLFIATTFVVVLSPGPAAIATTAEATANGFKRSLLVILGIASANLVYFILSATGIAALIIASNTLFSIIKWAGVAYLLYLGISAIVSKSGPMNVDPAKKRTGKLHRVFIKGFILEISNPKALLYFSALLPQFIDINQAIIPQIVIFAFICFILDFLCYAFYGYLGWKSQQIAMKAWVLKLINKTAGSMLIFAGLKMATVER